MRRRFVKLRTTRTAVTIRASENATCSTTSADRARSVRFERVDRTAFSDSVRRAAAACRIEIAPHISAVNAVAASVNSATGMLNTTLDSRGTSGGASATITFVSASPSPRPSTPPAPKSSAVSSAHCFPSLPCVAPSASRTAFSTRRDDTRVSISPDTFAHAMSSRSPTAANSAKSACRTGPKK